MQVLVRDNNVDQALKALKKKMQREGIFREMKLRGHYEKPSEKKAREKASDPPGAQARAQAHAARRLVADEATARPGRPRRSGARSAPTELLIDLRGGRPRPERGVTAMQRGPSGPRCRFGRSSATLSSVGCNNDRREAGEGAR